MIGKILLAGFVCIGMALGQSSSPPAAAAPVAPAATTTAAAAAAPTKAYAFDVVSIRQNGSAQSGGPQQMFGPTADGYRLTNMPIALVIMTAYVPQVGGAAVYVQNQVKGYQNWMDTETYDIDARISDADRAEWQKPEPQKVMLQAMLQALLVERCKIVVHREVKEVAVSSLVVAKGGPKFKPTDPTVEHPDGQKLPWGGVLVPTQNGMSFYGASMASFASILSSFLQANQGRPVQDKTGLTGNYDLVMKLQYRGGSAPTGQQDGTAASDPGSIFDSVLSDLGLKLDSGKGQVETLVIDHMERPSSN